MPALSLHKHLLRGVFAYAKCLQELHHRVLESRLESQPEVQIQVYDITQADSDASSISFQVLSIENEVYPPSANPGNSDLAM